MVSSFRSVLRRPSEIALVAALFAILIATSASAGPIEVFGAAVGGADHSFGSLTPTDWRLREGRGIGAGLDWYLTDYLSAEVSAVRQPQTVRIDGNHVGEFRSIEGAGMLKLHASLTPVIQPYIGAGVAYLMYRGHRTTPYGDVNQPDHAALMSEAGVDFVVSSKWKVMLGAEYGPARSTAEIVHANAPTEKVDFHQLYVVTGLRYRF